MTAPVAHVRSTARPAPLEQLRTNGRELEGGILAIDTCGSRWLFDIARRRYQCIDHAMDVTRALTFGTWEPFETIEWLEPDTVVLQPAAPRARLRLRLHGPACPDCAPDTLTVGV